MRAHLADRGGREEVLQIEVAVLVLRQRVLPLRRGVRAQRRDRHSLRS